MLRRNILAAIFIFGTITPSYAQDIGAEVTGALTQFFGGSGGELPVKDKSVLAQEIIQIAKLVEEINILLEQLADQYKQARLGGYSDSATTAALIAAQAEQQFWFEELLYAQGGSEMWPVLYTGEKQYLAGEWLGEARRRDLASLSTQRTLLRQLEMRQAAFAADEARITALGGAVSAAAGRNQLIAAHAGVDAYGLHQQHQTQQLLLTLGNALIVSAGEQKNEQMSREAQERGFLVNFRRPIQKVAFTNVGLANYASPIHQR